jgi:sodium transport system permease protein
MSLRNIAVVFRKELVDTLRDRRTLIGAILVPILLFPLMTFGFGGLAIYVATRAMRENRSVMLLGQEHAPTLAAMINKGRDKDDRVDVVPTAPDYVQRINAKQLRAAVEFPPGLEENIRTRPDQPQKVKVYWYEGEFRSGNVVRTLERMVRDYKEGIVVERLSARGLSKEILTPFEHKRQNVAAAEKVTGSILGMILPYFFIVLCLTGAMYPAMDLTAGEKERGTIETLLVSAASRTELVLGKFLLVMLVALCTTALSIASFLVTVVGGTTLIRQVTKELVLVVSGKAAAAVFLIVLPLAVVFAAALLAIAVTARNYREAQQYIQPLMFLIILPAMASFVPGVELKPTFALIPILNVSLAAKEIFAGNYPWGSIALIFGSTCVYAAAALYWAVRQFHREEVLFRT